MEVGKGVGGDVPQRAFYVKGKGELREPLRRRVTNAAFIQRRSFWLQCGE